MALTLLKGVLWLIVLGLTLWRSFAIEALEDERGPRPGRRVRFKPRVAIFGTSLLVALLLLFPAVGYVDAGSRGVVLRFGAVTGRLLGEGIYAVVPIVESVAHMDVQVHAEKLKASAASRDLQIVATEVTLNYALDPAQVAEVYRSLRYEYVERIIDPAIQEAVKATTARFDAEELITKRAVVRDGIQLFLTERLRHHGILIDAMSLTDFNFSKEFNDAIEAKVTAAQHAIKAENDLRRIRIEAEQRIAEARGEAEAIRIQAEGIARQGGDNYVALKWVEKWNGQTPQFIAGAGQGTAMLFQMPTKVER